MKKLVSVADIKAMAQKGEKEFFADDNTLITPAARDSAKEFGVKIVKGSPVNVAGCCTPKAEYVPTQAPVCTNPLDPAMIRKIVEQVMASMGGAAPSGSDLVRAIDPATGFMLIKGNSDLKMEPFNDGKRDHERVWCKDVSCVDNSPNMTAGFMEFDHSELTWTLTYDEFDYVIDGTLEFIVGGQKYTGQPGDVFFIPANTTVTFTTPNKTRFFFVTYPANWAELCGVK